ncbi:MAG TPA: DUF58 domain-containing protein [Chloroflexi bacterium]|nr:DUF58 domain-containing protein [Chloroflexota bacterium]HHW86128.1 DUF58 domain-containing protein [Chloroflexota bacterium]
MKPWAWALLGLALLAVVLRSAPLLLLTLLLALIAGAALLWWRVCLVGVSYRRRFSQLRLFHGDEATLDIELINAKPLPLAWLRAEDELPRALTIQPARLSHSHRPGRVRLINLVSLRWYERVTRHYRVQGVQRGAWAFGPARLLSGDMFGFAVREVEVAAIDTLLVYPRVVPLTALGLPADRPFGEFRAMRQLAEDPLRLNGARDYVSGDSMRYVHWKATARRGSLQTKTFDASANRPLALFLNINTHEHAWEGYDPDLQEYAITTSASLAHWAWEQGQAVGLFANTITQPGAQVVRIRPAGHRDQLTLIFEALARLVPFGRWPLEETLRYEGVHLPYGTTIVVVTALLTESLRRTLLYLHDRGFALALITLGAACDAPPIPGVRTYPVGGHAAWANIAAITLTGSERN